MRHELLNKFWLRVGIIVAVMSTTLAGTVMAETTYKLEQVTSVEAGGLYVFEQGGYVMSNTITSSALQTTNSYETTGLTGTETYVWTLESSGSGYKMKNVSWTGNMVYLTNPSSTSVTQDNNASIWVFNFQTDNTVLIQNTSNSNRFLGYTNATSHAYKAYATSNLSSYPHAIKVYQLVEDSSSPVVATTTTIDASGITNTDVYTGTTAGSLSATVTANGTAVSGATVTWSGDNNNVATINASTGAVTLVGAGTVTFTASYAGVSGEYQPSSATYEMTVTDSTPDYVTLPYSWAGGTKDALLAETGVTANGLGSDYAVSNAPYLVKFDTTGDYIQVKTDSQPGKVTIGVKMLGGATASSITVQESADGKTFTNVETLAISGTQNTVLSLETSNAFKAASRYVRLYFTKGSNVGVGPITIAEYSDTPVQVSTPEISGEESFLNSTEVSITCPTEGATIQYSLNDGSTWVTYTEPFTITETTTVKAKATKNDYTDSEVASKTFTKITPLTSVSALTAKTEAGSYYVTFSNAVVTFASGNYAYIQDASGAVAVYKSEHGLTAGDVFNGTATVAYQVRNGNPQITDLSGVTSVSGTAPEPTTVAASAWNYTFSNVLSQYFKVTGATITQNSGKYYISLGGESVQLYKVGTAISGLDLTCTYTIVGFPTLYNTTKELQIFADPEAEASTEPSIDVNSNAITATASETTGTITVTYNNITDVAAEVFFCDAEGGAATYDWLTAEIDSENNLYYMISANTGEARTAYMKVYALDDDANDVYSELITVTQAKFVVDYATLPFTFNGGKADIVNTAGLTQSGLGGDYNSSPKLKFDDTDDYLVLKINERPGVLTFDIKGNSFSGGTFTVQTSVDGTTYTDLETYAEINNTYTQSEEFNNLDANVRYIKWIYTTKYFGNVALGNINLAAYVAPTPSITVDPATANPAADEVEGTLAITYENLTIANMDDFDVQFCDEDGNGLDAALDWIMVEVAEADGREGYVVSYIMDANTGDARTAYFKVYAMDDDTNLVYSNLVTVTQAAYVAPPTEGTIVFGNNGTKINSASVTGDDSMGNTWTITSDGTTSYTQNTAYSQVGKGTQPATSITFTTTLPAEATITSFEAKFGGFGDTAGDVTLKVGENTVGTGSLNGTADVIVSNTSTATGTTLTVTVTNIAKGVKCYYISYEVEVEESIKVKLNASGYATFASTQVLDFTDAEGYTAWAVTAVNGSTITFSQITGPVPAGTGVLLKGTASTEYTLATGTEGIAPAGNLLEGVVAPKAIELGQYYGLKGNTFVKVNTGTVPAGKALLPASVVEASPVNAFTFNFDEDATAIKAIDNGQRTTDGVIYNVAGQRLSKMQKGINIVNGKKILK